MRENNTKKGDAGRVTARAVVRNSAGIHCRPTAVIVKEVRKYDVQATVKGPEGPPADLTSAIEVLSLGLSQGDTVELTVTGPDAEACGAKLEELFATEFDFPNAGEGG